MSTRNGLSIAGPSSYSLFCSIQIQSPCCFDLLRLFLLSLFLSCYFFPLAFVSNLALLRPRFFLFSRSLFVLGRSFVSHDFLCLSYPRLVLHISFVAFVHGAYILTMFAATPEMRYISRWYASCAASQTRPPLLKCCDGGRESGRQQAPTMEKNVVSLFSPISPSVPTLPAPDERQEGRCLSKEHLNVAKAVY
ncbi:hypothetical protein C8R45DRAFT_1037233 [Mycena sanguinolenta]|nr:hypothetical protein C8R45DRAFT_1037233 [Mycena sanguinolenta]